MGLGSNRSGWSHTCAAKPIWPNSLHAGRECWYSIYIFPKHASSGAGAVALGMFIRST